ncbi:hypothetical protein [Acholeplasma laidlawii]|uniref:hypothetical protein n=1 Tax=Acholeplasma laidlawii TaxID=2148 RepID=UPI0021F785D0|nr:hypothetical protein [Acholeplasma laidlawii]
MSTLSKKLFISVLTLILTVGAFTATTFAWFTLGNKASVGTFDAKVQSGGGLEVSYGGSGEWFNTITSERMNDYLSNDLAVSTLLSAVSSQDGKAFTSLNANGSAQDSTTSGYIEFTLKFRSLDPAKVVWQTATLGGAAVTFPSDIAFRLQNHSATTLNQSITAYASNAARISVTPITRAVTATPVIGNATVFEKAAGTDNNIATGALGVLQADGAHDYYARKGNPLLGFSHTNQGTGSPLPIDFNGVVVAPTLSTLPLTELMTLVKTEAQNPTDDYHYGEFVVRIWLEGWDADTYNAIFDAPLTVALSFIKID